MAERRAGWGRRSLVRPALDALHARRPRPGARRRDQRRFLPAELPNVVVRQPETLVTVVAQRFVETREAGKLVPEALHDDRVRLAVVERGTVAAEEAFRDVLRDRTNLEVDAAVERRAERRH